MKTFLLSMLLIKGSIHDISKLLWASPREWQTRVTFCCNLWAVTQHSSQVDQRMGACIAATGA